MKSLLLFLLLFLFVSCSSNDGNDIVSTNIDYFTEDLKVYDGSAWTRSKERYDLKDGKYFKKTNLSEGNTAFQTHFYTNGLLTEERTNMSAQYTYSGQQLIAMTYTNGGDQQFFRRFIAMPSNIYYIEVLTAAYDDTNSQVTQRFIEQFDANDNVISVGEDANLDGVVDAATHFFYQNGDMVTAQEPNGTIHNYAYSDTIDNYNDIAEKTYGKKSKRLIFVQEYLDAVANSGLIKSIHLKQSVFENTQYQVLSNNYVKKIYYDFTSGSSRFQGTTLFYFK
ncbi:MAG: hypothetical protein ACOVNM_08085 [Flavobacterium sp.]|jgi:hypothetical protein